MGNAPQKGMSCIFDEKNVKEDYDIIVIGLQESTYSGSTQGCIQELGDEIKDMLGDTFYQVKNLSATGPVLVAVV